MIRGLVIAALTATNGHVLKMSSEVMSELPYMALSLGALILWARAEERRDVVYLVASFLVLWAAVAVRTAGLSLVAGLVLWTLIRRQWILSVVLGAIGAIAVSLVGGWVYVTDMLIQVNPYQPGAMLTWGALLDRILSNTVAYGAVWIPQAVVPVGAEYVSFIPSLVAIWWIVARWRTLPALYLGCYLAMLLAWPKVWTDIRFVVPVIPVLYLAIFDRAMWVRKRLERTFEETA